MRGANRKVRSGETARVNTASGAGFTLVELLVVIAVIAILASLLLPALGRAKELGQRAKCVGNLSQIQKGFIMFSDDTGYFPSNNLVYGLNHGLIPHATWAPVSLDADSTNEAAAKGCLYEYLPSLEVYRCPSHRPRLDPPEYTGIGSPRLHSYNLSIWLNCITVPSGYHTDTELAASGKSPSEIFAFVDTHEQSIIDPAFGLYPANSIFRDIWVNLPADRHGRGSNLSFLDGHVEHYRWKTRKVFVKNGQKSEEGPDRDDQRKLQRALPPPRE